MRGERFVIDETCLRVCLLKLVDRLEQRLDWILEIVALVDHVGGVEASELLPRREYQLVKDQEEDVRLDRARGEVVVAVLGVVEVEATQLANAKQPRDDELDVRVRQVMPEIDETLRTFAERLCEHERRAPVLHDGGIKGRLVWLVLGEQAP